MKHEDLERVIGVRLTDSEVAKISEDWAAFYREPDKYANSVIIDMVLLSIGRSNNQEYAVTNDSVVDWEEVYSAIRITDRDGERMFSDGSLRMYYYLFLDKSPDFDTAMPGHQKDIEGSILLASDRVLVGGRDTEINMFAFLLQCFSDMMYDNCASRVKIAYVLHKAAVIMYDKGIDVNYEILSWIHYTWESLYDDISRKLNEDVDDVVMYRTLFKEVIGRYAYGENFYVNDHLLKYVEASGVVSLWRRSARFNDRDQVMVMKTVIEKMGGFESNDNILDMIIAYGVTHGKMTGDDYDPSETVEYLLNEICSRRDVKSLVLYDWRALKEGACNNLVRASFDVLVKWIPALISDTYAGIEHAIDIMPKRGVPDEYEAIRGLTELCCTGDAEHAAGGVAAFAIAWVKGICNGWSRRGESSFIVAMREYLETIKRLQDRIIPTSIYGMTNNVEAHYKLLAMRNKTAGKETISDIMHKAEG